MARLMNDNSAGHPVASSAASTSNASSSSSPTASRKSSMATEEANNTSSKRINLQRTPSSKLRGKTVSPPRKPSFKLREIRPGGPKNTGGYRATKVTVPSNSVALLASHFNAVVVHNDTEGRKLLKKLNSQKQIHVSASAIEGCVKATIKKFETGDVDKSDVLKKNSKGDSLHQNDASQHTKRYNVQGNVFGMHQNDIKHQTNGHHVAVIQQNSSVSHNQQPERPKFVVVRKNSSISKFSRKSSVKNSSTSTQNSRLSSIESKDALLRSGSTVSSASSSPVKVLRKLSNPPKLTPKPLINQRTILLKPVLAKCPQSTRSKDYGDSSKLNRNESKRTVPSSTVTNDGSSRTVVRKNSSDSVFCSDEETGKSSDDVPKTVKKIWRRYQVTNTRSISSIARDFVNSDSSIDGSVVQTLRNAGENEKSLEENCVKQPEVVKEKVEKCEGCNTMGKPDFGKINHSKTCDVQRRLHHNNDDAKVKKEGFRKYLVKSEHIVAVQNELMATNKAKESKNDVDTGKEHKSKKITLIKDVYSGKEHKRYGRIIVSDAKVLKSLVNEHVNVNEEDSTLLNKGSVNSKPVLDHVEDDFEVDKENLLFNQTKKESDNEDNCGINKENLNISNSVLDDVVDGLIVDKENMNCKSANQSTCAKNVPNEDRNSALTKSQAVKPKLQPKPSKLPDSRRKVQIISRVITSPAKSKPISTFGLSIPKDQSILESALNGMLSKDENGGVKENNEVKNRAIQKDLVKPNRSFLWNTLKDKESTQNHVVSKDKKENDIFQDPGKNIIPITADSKKNEDENPVETKLKSKDVLDVETELRSKEVVTKLKPKDVANATNTLDAKVKNTSFLFRKTIKSLPANDNLDEPIYMNGQVALSTSDIDSRLKESEMVSNFRSMINFDSALGRAKTKENQIIASTKNVGDKTTLVSDKNVEKFVVENGDIKSVIPKTATKNGVNKLETIKTIEETNSEVYEEFGNSDSEGTIYEDVDSGTSPDQSQGFKYMNVYIAEARNNNIIETINQVMIVQQTTGYEEIERIDEDMGSNIEKCLLGDGKVDPKKSSAEDYSGSKSSYAYIDPNPSPDPKKDSGDYSGSKSSYAYIDPGSADVLAVQLDVPNGKKMADDTYASISGEDFSENIYDDIIHLKPKVLLTEGDSCHYECIYQSELAGSSDSSCDQSNSLYGVVPGRQLSQSSVGVYQLHEPRANTSETSDEWIDLDTSGGDVEIYLYEKRNRPKAKSSSGSWSQKVRRQWSVKQAENSSWDGSSDFETSSHQYEAVQGLSRTTSSHSTTSHPQPPPASFDSDSSFEDDDDDEEGAPPPSGAAPWGTAPQQSKGAMLNEGIYGFMKQASKRMRKHWSLGKSLRRIKKMASVEEQRQQEDPVTNGSNTSLNRRRWSSFKSKFKPQLSSSGSVFYLDKEQGDTPDCIPNVYSDKPSPTTPTPVTIATDTRRYSIASSSLRPTSPPPPPPPQHHSTSHRQSLCEEVIAKRGGLRSVGGGEIKKLGEDSERGVEGRLRGGGRLSGGGDRLGGGERLGGGDRLGGEGRLVGSERRGGGRERLGGGVEVEGILGGDVRGGGGGGIGGDVRGGGGGGSDRGVQYSPGNGEYSNSSWTSENGDSSWDRRTSGMMSDHSSSHGSDLHLRFADEPLYQFYNETVTKEELNKCYSTNDSNRGSMADFDSDGYEEIGNDRLISRPSAMDLITPKQGHHRTLWCEIPEVVQSEILKTLSKEERRLQEAKFEVMTSEASYFKSLTVLEKHFANSPAFRDETVLPTDARKSLFGQLAAVKRCSERLLAALDRCWQESIMLANLSEIVAQHAKRHFHVYVTYCSNHIDLNSTLRKLKETNKRFEEELSRLESDAMCESLSLHSFLMLPMQRVTRMPLLIDAILTKLDPHHAEYESSKASLRILNEFVQKCNEATRQQERVIEMVKISRQLEFSQEVRTLPIVSQSRWLVRSGQVVQLNSETITQKQTFGRKLTRQGMKITLFLFNDLMLITKKKGEESFIVLDHCARNLIQMTAEDDVGNALKNLIKVAMLKNHEGKLVEMLISCDSETSQQRWLQAMSPPQSSEEGESIYEAWDCPQVIAIHVYKASQPDELSIQRGDVINVLRKMVDGWYYGERTRDGEKGWFPGNHAQEIISQHIRARNLQQRYRLLMMSGSILESQKGNTNNKKQK